MFETVFVKGIFGRFVSCWLLEDEDYLMHSDLLYSERHLHFGVYSKRFVKTALPFRTVALV